MRLFKFEDFTKWFEKSGSFDIRLKMPPDLWEEEVLQILIRSNPWIVDFSPNVEFYSKDEDTYDGIGSVILRVQIPPVPMGQYATPAPVTEEVGRIPVIVVNGKLKPLDLFVVHDPSGRDRVLPLTEDNFRETISEFLQMMGTVHPPVQMDRVIVGQLWPPGRSSFGGPGAELGLSVVQKMSSDEDESEESFPIVNRILSGDIPWDAEKKAILEKTVESGPLSSMLGPVLKQIFANLPLRTNLSGTIIQVKSLGDGQFVRATSPEKFSLPDFMSDHISDVPPGKMQIVCVCDSPAKIRLRDIPAEVEFDRGGIFVSTLKDGSRMRQGVLITHVANHPNKSLFVDVDHADWALESDFCIDSLHKELPIDALHTDLSFSDLDKGEMIIFFDTKETEDGNESVVVWGPFQVVSSYPGEELLRDLITTPFLDVIPKMGTLKLVINPHIEHIEKEENTLFVPQNPKFFILGKERFKPLPPSEDEDSDVVVKKAEEGDMYIISGKPAGKLSGIPLNWDDASLTLAALGINSDDLPAVQKLASKGVEITNCRPLNFYEQKKFELLPSIDVDLLKAASVLDDDEVVDAAIGLNLAEDLTEDQLGAVVEQLEEVKEHLARLLLLSRLGKIEVPEEAIKTVLFKLNPITSSISAVLYAQGQGTDIGNTANY
jgi:hypothetical protein